MSRVRTGMEIVDLIDVICKKRNSTRRELCRHINIPTSTIATWKTRNIFPNVNDLGKIALFLNVSLDWLVFELDTDSNKQIDMLTQKAINQEIIKINCVVEKAIIDFENIHEQLNNLNCNLTSGVKADEKKIK